jgi:hypothetical protein
MKKWLALPFRLVVALERAARALTDIADLYYMEQGRRRDVVADDPAADVGAVLYTTDASSWEAEQAEARLPEAER